LAVRVTVVLVWFSFPKVAVPVVRVQLEKLYPLEGVAEILIGTPKLPDVELTGVVEPCPSFVKVRVIGFAVKFAVTVALPFVNDTVVESVVAEVIVAVPEVDVQFEKEYPVFATAFMGIKKP
jgi:hypothetical protein